jgi:hypothetical protein
MRRRTLTLVIAIRAGRSHTHVAAAKRPPLQRRNAHELDEHLARAAVYGAPKCTCNF